MASPPPPPARRSRGAPGQWGRHPLADCHLGASSEPRELFPNATWLSARMRRMVLAPPARAGLHSLLALDSSPLCEPVWDGETGTCTDRHCSHRSVGFGADWNLRNPCADPAENQLHRTHSTDASWTTKTPRDRQTTPQRTVSPFGIRKVVNSNNISSIYSPFQLPGLQWSPRRPCTRPTDFSPFHREAN